MIRKKILAAALGIVLACGTMAGAAPITDIVQAPTPYFAPDQFSTYNAPYYRWYNEDWGWSHSAIGAPFATATLNISAWDVDALAFDPEIDLVYANDSGTWVLLGSLAGLDNAWGYSNFVLGANFFDDIATGLQIFLDIDSTHQTQYWAVSLAKSVLSLDGGIIPNPNPNIPAPEPSTFLLVGAGLAGAAALRKRLKK